jgi:ADP-heptose:LPS heptosyltransferase
MEKHGIKIVLVAGKSDSVYSKAVEDAMKSKPINLSGEISPGELACLFRRCRLLISNDSGPVHVAAAVGTPVISIFGRNQAGLGPKRWGPVGEGHIILHKGVGGDIDRRTLEALTIEEVLAAAEKILNKRS